MSSSFDTAAAIGAMTAALAAGRFAEAMNAGYAVLHTAIDAVIAGDFEFALDGAQHLCAVAPEFHHAAFLRAVAAAALGRDDEAAAARAEGLAVAPQLAPFYDTLAARRGGIRRFIPQVKCEVVADCQFDCTLCAHGDLRQRDIAYHLTLEQLRAFLAATLESGYLIGQIAIHGSGEPLLWKHLTAGLEEIKRSGAICWTWITSNGLLLHRLGADDLARIDCMDISLYQDNKKADIIGDIVAAHRQKLFIVAMDDFVDVPRKAGGKLPVPCACTCDGPMLVGDKLYLYCGPPVFGAGKLLGRNPDTDLSLWTKVAPNYLDRSRNLTGRLDYCAWCWANGHHQKHARRASQRTTGGNWKTRPTG
ncbi:MAG: radical SAM protein [Rhodospirillaceae bacterium]